MASICRDGCSCGSKRTAFHETEVQALMQGIRECGVGCWAAIGQRYGSSFHKSRSTDSWTPLRFKWRSLVKNYGIKTGLQVSPRSKAEPIVQYVLQQQLKRKIPTFVTNKGAIILPGE